MGDRRGKKTKREGIKRQKTKVLVKKVNTVLPKIYLLNSSLHREARVKKVKAISSNHLI